MSYKLPVGVGDLSVASLSRVLIAALGDQVPHATWQIGSELPKALVDTGPRTAATSLKSLSRAVTSHAP